MEPISNLFPSYLTHVGTWKAFWPLPVTAFLLSGLIYYVVRPTRDKLDLFLVVLAFSTLGLIAGYITAFSRAPAVGAVMPAVLSLIGGLAVFLIGRNKATRQVTALSVFVFSLTLALGMGWGGVMRSNFEEYFKGEQYLKQRAYIESEVQGFRRSLGLTPSNSAENTASPK